MPERTVNRYYDPTTDEFLSIDPDVMTTDQPYVFTNDNSLNDADPLGLVYELNPQGAAIGIPFLGPVNPILLDGSGVVEGGLADIAATSNLLTNLASDSEADVGEGAGHVHGTLVHTRFGNLVEGLDDSQLSSEVSYENGMVVKNGTRGSVRLDVVQGDTSQPAAVYDLKTGSGKLTPNRIAQIRSQLPKGFQHIPVITIRP